MLSEAYLFDQYGQTGIVRAGEIYLSIPQAFNFVADCQKNDLAVIGIEGCLYEGGVIKPQLDTIADYSSSRASTWKSYRNICNQSAKDFLEQLKSIQGIVLNFVVLSEKEWAYTRYESEAIAPFPPNAIASQN